MPSADTPLIIDVEASGFGGASYPIEIGVALDDGHKYCALILPEPEWTHWDAAAERSTASRGTFWKPTAGQGAPSPRR